MDILIVGGDSSAGLAIIQSLGRAGYRCCIAGKSQEHAAFASRYALQRLTYPDPMGDSDAFCEWVIALHQQHKFRVIIPTTEETLIPLNGIRNQLDFESVLAIPSPSAVETAFDKEKIRQLAESLGIPSPQNILAETPEDLEAADFSEWLADGAIVLKTIRSKVWKDGIAREHQAQVFTNEAALRTEAEGLLPLTPVQLQQWVPGCGVGIEILARDGEIMMTFAHHRLHEVPLTGGASSYRKAINPPPALLADARKLIHALNWQGVAMVEFRWDESTGRHWLMEINGRFWGSLPLANFAGADFPKALVEMMLEDKTPELQPGRVGVYARQIPREVNWFKHSLKHRNNPDPTLLKPPIGKAILQWARVLIGRDAWDGATWRDPKPILYTLSKLVRDEIGLLGEKVRRRWLLRRAKQQAAPIVQNLNPVQRVVVLCYGNICRSPYAALRLKQLRPELEVESSGFHSNVNRYSPEFIVSAARELGIDQSVHTSQKVTTALLEQADLIILMDQRNHDLLQEFGKQFVRKSVWLGAFGNGPVEIDDPYDEPDRAPELLQSIDDALNSLTKILHTAPAPAAIH